MTRRVLRLFPLYYVTLFVTYLLLGPVMAEQLPWNVLYLSNVYHFLDKRLGLGSHFWTLSVEEQFYIMWAFVILLLPKRAIWTVLTVLIIIAPISRVLAAWYGLFPFDYLTPACFDAIGLGATISLLGRERYTVPGLARLLSIIGLGVGLPVYLLLVSIRSYGHFLGISSLLVQPLQFFFGSLFFFWVVARAAKGFTGPVKTVLEFSVIVYLGKITYGLYVLHPFVPVFMRAILDQTSIGYLVKPFTYWFSVKYAASVGLATLSWYLLERPIQKLRRYLPY